MIIPASNADSNLCPDNSMWYPLGEFPLTDLLLHRNRRDDLTADLLSQVLSTLGITLECVAAFAKELQGHFRQGERVRVFCQRRMIVQPAQIEHTLEKAPVILGSNTKMGGGWGYFLIERGGNASPDCPDDAGNLVDVYLYREGE